jgi:hypothetical protein
MYPYPDSVLAPIQAKSQKIQLGRASRLAFLPVHFQFQLAFKKLRTTLLGPLVRSPARLSDAAQAATLSLLT